MSAREPQLETPEEARERLQAEAHLSAVERDRLWRRIEYGAARGGPRTRLSRPLLWAPALAAAAATLAILLLGDEAPPTPQASTPDPCTLDARRAQLELPAHCAPQTLQMNGDEWRVEASTRVEREPEGARVVSGRVRFRVAPRPGAARFRVRVSHGQVVVIGTVFRVEQRTEGGSVHVSEGVIEFVWSDGQRERVSAGGTLSWPRETETEPETEAESESEAEAESETETEPEVDMDRVIGRLLQLRSQRRHDEAARLLRETLRAPGLTRRQRERISYELGLTLEASGASACAHWRRHHARFGAGLHAAELDARLERCNAP